MRIFASPRGARRYAAAALLAMLVAGFASCATPPSDPVERAAFDKTNDPLEPLNRHTLDFNLFLDRILLKPVTKVYIAIVPEEGRDALRRALRNMREPVIVINNVLQGELDRAGIAAGRFMVNSTAGIGGLMDVAENIGIPKESGDFGQTLFVWGMPEGPYLVLPLLGPSNPRDAIGRGADAALDPFSYLGSSNVVEHIQITRFVLGGIDQRAEVINVLDDLEKNSLDFYAQLRSLAQQRRAAELRRGAAPEPDASFYDDPAAKPAAAPPPADPATAPAPSARP